MTLPVAIRTLPPVDTRNRHSFTTTEYHQLIEEGLFEKDERIELINGELTIMPPIGPEHSAHTTELNHVAGKSLPGDLRLRLNEPITIAPHSEPQPDAAIVRASKDNYRKAHPKPKDVLLVIEVADSSAPYDNHVKSKLYGKAGIPEFWVIDIAAECVRVFTEPAGKGYRKTTEYYREDRIKCGTVPQLKLAVNDLLL